MLCFTRPVFAVPTAEEARAFENQIRVDRAASEAKLDKILGKDQDALAKDFHKKETELLAGLRRDVRGVSTERRSEVLAAYRAAKKKNTETYQAKFREFDVAAKRAAFNRDVMKRRRQFYGGES